jgi:hypothetical protein
MYDYVPFLFLFLLFSHILFQTSLLFNRLEIAGGIINIWVLVAKLYASFSLFLLFYYIVLWVWLFSQSDQNPTRSCGFRGQLHDKIEAIGFLLFFFGQASFMVK